MTTQRCFLYAIVFMMAISYMAMVVQGSAQLQSHIKHTRRTAHDERKNAIASQNIRSTDCGAGRNCTIKNFRPCLQKFGPIKASEGNPPPPCSETRRHLLQEGVESWDEFVFGCTTACENSDTCSDCDDTLASECGEVLSYATEDWFDTYNDPDGGWTAKCALAAEVANPDLGTQCVVCLFDILDPSAATGTPSAGSRSVHGHYLASSVLGVILAGVGVVLPV